MSIETKREALEKSLIWHLEARCSCSECVEEMMGHAGAYALTVHVEACGRKTIKGKGVFYCGSGWHCETAIELGGK